MGDYIVKVILDTNVFIAAYWASHSASARLIQACFDGVIRAQYTEEIKREVMYILRKIKATDRYMAEINRFWERAELVEAVPVNSVEVADPDDRKFLEAAAGGETDFLVTNDDHLLSIGHIGRTEILTPSSTLRLLQIKAYN